MAGALNSSIFGMHLSFADNGFGQTGIADIASCESEENQMECILSSASGNKARAGSVD